MPQPFCEPVRLFCGCEPDKLPKDLAEELPKELRMVESQKLEEKAKKTKEADAGAAVARACGVNNKQTTFEVCTTPVCPPRAET